MKYVLMVFAFIMLMAHVAAEYSTCYYTYTGTVCYFGYCFDQTVTTSYTCWIDDKPHETTKQTNYTQAIIPQNPTGGMFYSFGSSDVDRYKTLMNQSTRRASYYMEVIAWDYKLTKEQFENKYLNKSYI